MTGNIKNTPVKGIAGGLALTAGATLLLEMSLTRIFSITMWYHYAFMAISIALFGLSFGAVLVYVKPVWFPREKTSERLAQLSLAYVVAILVCFWLHLQVPFTPTFTFVGVGSVVLSFVLVAVPFLISGVIVCLSLTRFTENIGKIYAFDLAGAAAGSLLLPLLVRPLTGPGVVLCSSLLAALAALLYSSSSPGRWRRISAAAIAVTFFLVVQQPFAHLFEIKWVKNVWGLPNSERVVKKPDIEMWNEHAVITVFSNVLDSAFAWGMSPTYQPKKTPEQLMLTIDAAAGTVLTKFDGNFNDITHLKYDVTSMVHYMRPESDVLVVGVGGGRDILTSLLYNPKSVTGIEINDQILELINRIKGDFTGHLDLNPKVNFYHDEARSFIERSSNKWDVIQISLIDSWAATSAGAFVLTENNLYTHEAWREFLAHLNNDGVLSVSRWWVRQRPGEVLRLLSMAYSVLKEMGVENPRDHIMVAASEFEVVKDSKAGVASVLVSPTPFSKKDLATFNTDCENLKFTKLLTPEMSDMDVFAQLLDPKTHDSVIANHSLDITPPTDERPFFFHTLRFRDAFKYERQNQWVTSFNMRAVMTLLILLAIVILLSVTVLILPVWWVRRKRGASSNVRELRGHSLYFAAIGLGFIMLEIALLQRFTLFFGQPLYSLTAVLFSLLVATSLGSWLTGRFILNRIDSDRRFRAALATVFAMTLLTTLALPPLMSLFHGAQLTPRVVFAVITMFLLGIPMGSCFPIGLTAAERTLPEETPWLWSINGALSVVGSVLAVIVSIAYGITATALLAVLCYLVAMLALYWNLKKA